MIKFLGLLQLLLLTNWWSQITYISRTNSYKKLAQEAFMQQQYTKAAYWYFVLLKESKEPSPEVRLNLAHAYYLQNHLLKAAREYQQVIRHGTDGLRSVAQQQIANQLAIEGNFEAAIQLYKESLKSDPGNQKARYNYELLMKKIQQENQQNQEQNSPAQNRPKTGKQEFKPSGQNESPTENKTKLGQSESGNEKETNRGGEKGDALGENISGSEGVDSQSSANGKEGELPGSATTSNKLQQINMSEEKARVILNSLRDAEQQYLQQLPRKHKSKPEKGKPDW